MHPDVEYKYPAQGVLGEANVPGGECAGGCREMNRAHLLAPSTVAVVCVCSEVHAAVVIERRPALIWSLSGEAASVWYSLHRQLRNECHEQDNHEHADDVRNSAA